MGIALQGGFPRVGRENSGEQNLKTGEKVDSSSVISLGIKGGKLVYPVTKPTLLIINPEVERPFLGLSF